MTQKSNNSNPKYKDWKTRAGIPINLIDQLLFESTNCYFIHMLSIIYEKWRIADILCKMIILQVLCCRFVLGRMCSRSDRSWRWGFKGWGGICCWWRMCSRLCEVEVIVVIEWCCFWVMMARIGISFGAHFKGKAYRYIVSIVLPKNSGIMVFILQANR